MKNESPEVDRYIENAPPFAQPILKRIRKAFHKADPRIEETMKWSAPHFEYQGILANLAAFKQHVRWGFWNAKRMSDPHGLFKESGMAMKVTDVKELPPDSVLIDYIREAVRLNEEGKKILRKPSAPAKPAEVPSDLASALKKNAKARAAFEKFSPSHKNEYIEWITEAKQAATRQKRLAMALEWMAEGKPRNWKYMRK